MRQKVLFITLLLLHYTTPSPTEMRVNCNEDVTLKCLHGDIDHMNFLSVTWYKLSNQKKHGIIRRGKEEEATQYYNFTRVAWFGKHHSLLLPSVTPADSGRYECAISANIGGQNLNLQVNLIVGDVCVDQADLTTTTNVLNVTQSDSLCHKEIDDLPVMWSVIGVVTVGLTKIILSLISISVIRLFCVRSSRRQLPEW